MNSVHGVDRIEPHSANTGQTSWKRYGCGLASLFADGLDRLNLPGRAAGGQVVGGLEVHPEIRGGAEGLGQQPCGVGGDAALATDQLVQPLNRDAQMGRERHLRNAKRLQKIGRKNHARMCRYPVCRSHNQPPKDTDDINGYTVSMQYINTYTMACDAPCDETDLIQMRRTCLIFAPTLMSSSN